MTLITELEILRSEAGYGEETSFPFIILEFYPAYRSVQVEHPSENGTKPEVAARW